MKPGIYDSWEIISDNIIIKNTDKSVFKYKGSGIPMGIREFFQIQDIKPNEKKTIKLIHDSKEYKAYIHMEKNPLARTRMFWYKDLSDILNSYLPDYESYFNKNNTDNKSAPIMRFQRIDDYVYKLDFLIEKKIENDVINETEEFYDYIHNKEGKTKYRLSKQYERDPKNRLEAIKIHGTKCLICGFDFKETYGVIGDGFIEIHHITPLSEINEETIVNPKTDLIPVCSNCHRIIHRERDNILSPQELREILNKLDK